MNDSVGTARYFRTGGAACLVIALSIGAVFLATRHSDSIVLVRWRDGLSASSRHTLERRFQLSPVGTHEGATWTYELGDASPDNIRALVRSRDVEDTHHLDRVSFVVETSAPVGPRRRWLIDRSPLLRPASAFVLGLSFWLALLGAALVLYPQSLRVRSASHRLASALARCRERPSVAFEDLRYFLLRLASILTMSDARGAPNRWPSTTSLVAVVGLVAVLAALLWVLDPFDQARSIDGELYAFTIQSHLTWGKPFDSVVINFFQGVVSQLLPHNPWANPAFIPFQFMPNGLAQIVGKAAVLAIYVVATYVLARTVGANSLSSAIAAQCVGVSCVPPMSTALGIHTLLPGNASGFYVVAILLMIYALFLGPRDTTWRNTLAAAATAALLAWYATYCDVLWTMVHVASMVLMAGLTALGCSRRWILSRLGFGLVVIGFLWMTGALEYVQNMARYPARVNFMTEIYGEVQDRGLSSYLLRVAGVGRIVSLFVVLGCLFGARLGGGHLRAVSIASVLHMALLLCLSLLFVYSDLNWTYPLPVYLDFAAYPVYGVAAVLGWVLALERAVTGIRVSREPASHRRAGFSYALAFALPLLVVACADRDRSSRPSPAPSSEITSFLRRQIALRPGQPFRGSVASVIGVGGDPFDKWQWITALRGVEQDLQNLHALHDLWREGIPTIEEYGHYVSPQLYYVLSRALSRPGDFHSRNWALVTHVDSKILGLLGVRYVITDHSRNLPLAGRVMDLVGENTRLSLFELERTNVGAYSPVHPVVAKSARESLNVLQGDGFDPTATVVLEEPLDVPLSPARDVLLRFDKQEMRISATSTGHSLLVLPVQFTACWQIHDAPNARLLRADFLLTGVEFSGSLDARITNDFGMASPSCRGEDIAAIRRLRIEPDGTVGLPPNLRPHARWSLRRFIQTQDHKR